MRILSLFSGIGAFEKALKNIGIDIDLVAFCEFDKYATKSYCAIHGVDESLNLGDITKVDEKTLPKDIDLITYGFPCQDISLAGKKQGMFNEDGTHTRSGLFFDALRIIEETKPKYAIAENVKNLVSKRFNAQFQVVLSSLDTAGYNSYYKVLNAKDYGIPQNRERVFIVSIRKDVDNGTFTFPEGFPLDLRLRDLLEPEVDEKFYLSEKGFKLFQKQEEKRLDYTTNNAVVNPHVVGGIGEKKSNHGTQWYQQDRVYDDNVALSVTTRLNPYYEIETNHNYRIRNLTPKECFRLMGFDDEDFEKAQSTNSNIQLYKQAGNSIVVDVLEYLLTELFVKL